MESAPDFGVLLALQSAMTMRSNTTGNVAADVLSRWPSRRT